MSTKTKCFTVGSTVAINRDLVWCWGAAANVIAEIVDCRLAGGREYVFKLMCVSTGEIIAEDVPAADLNRVMC